MADLTRMTGKGEMTATYVGRDPLGNAQFAVTLAGTTTMTRATCDTLPRMYAGKVPAEYTHWLTQSIGKSAPVLLTSVEAATLATVAAATRTPEEIADETMRALRSERAALVAAYRGTIDEQQYQYERAHDEQDPMAYTVKDACEPAIAAAHQEIADFDAAHPEVIEAINEESAESVRRGAWI